MIPVASKGRWRITYDQHGCQLFSGRDRWMTSDPSETKLQQDLADQCKGRVLVGGLGIGMVVEMLNKNEAVTEITVIEKEQDVVDLVWEYIDTSKSTLVLGTIEDSIAGLKAGEYDTICLDTWLTCRLEIFMPIVNSAKEKCDNVVWWDELKPTRD